MSTDIGSAPNRHTVRPQSAIALRSSSLFPVITGLIALAAASLPYVIADYRTKAGVYLWAGTSPSDFAVYLAWIRAAAGGCLRDPHLFAGGHPGMLINPVYLIMGIVCRLTRLSGTLTYHLFRIVCGGVLLYVLYRFVRFCTPDPLTRRLAFLFLCFSSGFGWCLYWLPLKYWSIDRWQPEAFTFLSLYTYPHVCVALTLQVSIIWLLLKSVVTGSRRSAAGAGLCGSLLAIVHTYDIISLALVWLFYVLAPLPGSRPAVDATRRRMLWSTYIAGVLTAPGVAFMFYQLRADRVFADRAAEPTMSAPLYTVIIGYGGILALAIIGGILLSRNARKVNPNSWAQTTRTEVGLLLVVWAIFNIVAAYIPVSFQRKMLQGEHVPLCILAALGSAWILRRSMPAWNFDRLRVPEVTLVAFLSLGSVAYIRNDTAQSIADIQQKQYRSTMLTGEIGALNWIDRHTPSNAVVQPIPWVAFDAQGRPHTIDTTVELYSPGLTGRPEYVGHWAESPHYNSRNSDVATLAFSRASANRIDIVRKSHIEYLIFSQKRNAAAFAAFDAANDIRRQGRGTGGVDLRRVYGNADADVYQVGGAGVK